MPACAASTTGFVFSHRSRSWMHGQPWPPPKSGPLFECRTAFTVSGRTGEWPTPSGRLFRALAVARLYPRESVIAGRRLEGTEFTKKKQETKGKRNAPVHPPTATKGVDDRDTFVSVFSVRCELVPSVNSDWNNFCTNTQKCRPYPRPSCGRGALIVSVAARKRRRKRSGCPPTRWPHAQRSLRRSARARSRGGRL
jgi:hypothetical protein